MTLRQSSDSTVKRCKFNEVLQDTIDSSADIIVSDLGLPADIAIKSAEIVVSRLQELAGGEGIYISKGYLWAVREEHRRIYMRFTGSNHTQLAHEFGVSVRHIYDVVKRVRQAEA